MIPKFKAWDKKDKVIREITAIDWSIDLVEFMNGAIERDIENVEFMQSTGLKDKNGVEIFTGQIVAVKYSESGYHYFEKIVFENGAYLAGDEDWLYNVKEYCVVCGNIYENPELLEVEGK
ncbi:YopX family protein [Enterococcus sp. AZ007]|uniref:YopX family protein n=1 Tax=Enterococcus sp. AZ007 TaxID=2774839 RepID=UPI003F281990